MAPSRRPRPARPDHFRTRRLKKPKAPTEWVLRITGLAGIVTIILVLLGFGVTLSADSWGHIPNNALYTAPSELIALSAVAIGTFVERSGRMEILYDLLADTVPYAGIWAGAVALGVLIATWPGAPVVERARRIRQQVSNRMRARLARGSRSRATINALAGLAGVLVGVPLVVAAYFCLMIAMACLLAAVPLIGYTAGKLYIDEWVVGPKRCQDEAGNVHDKIATCVTVKTKDFGNFTGLIVYSTTSVIVLYVRMPGSPSKVVRIPLAEAVIEAQRSTVTSDQGGRAQGSGQATGGPPPARKPAGS